MEEKEKLIWWKWTKRIIASLGIFIVVLVGLSFLVINLYEEEIKQFAVKKINEKLTAKVSVKSIDLTLFDQFPMASLRFTEVFIPDTISTTKNDTLISIQQLYLSLNFMDLINGNYAIKDIKAVNTIANLRINKKGIENYMIWKESEDSDENDQFSFDLEKVRFNTLDLSYRNAMQQQTFDFFTESLKFKGKFSEVEYQLETISKLYIKKFKNKDITYLRNKDAKIDLKLLINTKNNSYIINKGALDLEKLSFSIDGQYISENNKNAKVDLNITGNNISFLSVFSMLPASFSNYLIAYKAKGLVDFKAKIKGELGKDIQPTINANFSLIEGGLTEKETGVSLTNLSFIGSFSNEDLKHKTLLKLKNIKGKMDNEGGSFSGELTLKDFSNLTIESNLKASLNLAVLKGFINIPTITTLTGTAALSYDFVGQYFQNEFVLRSSYGNADFEKVTLLTTLNNISFSNFSGKGVLNQNNLHFEKLEGLIASSFIKANITLNNLIPFALSESEIIEINADVSAKKVDLKDLMLQFEGKEVSTQAGSDTISFPKQFKINFNAAIDELTYENFTAKNLSGQIALHDQKLSTKNISFKTSKGSVLFNSEWEQTPQNNFYWRGSANLENIDMKEFLRSVDNFSQTFLTSENIKGRATLNLDFELPFSPNLTLITAGIKVLAETKITDGALIEHPTINELGTYLNGNSIINKFVDTESLLKKMHYIKFSELHNTIKIENSTVFIPKMKIQSNVLDINLAGEHTFDNVIDYHFNFGLRDVLIKNKHAEDFGPIQDDGLGKVLFIRVFGPLDNLNYEIDKTEKIASRKEQQAEEKENLKSILKNEFGFFKKDSTVKAVKKTTNEPTFEIEEWEEEPEKSVTPPEEKEKKKKTNKFLKKLGVDDSDDKGVELQLEKN